MAGGSANRHSIAQEQGRTAWVVGAAVREWNSLTASARAHATVTCQSVLRCVEQSTSKFRKVKGCKHNVWEIKNTSENIRFFAVKDGPDLYIARIVKKPAKSDVVTEANLAWDRASEFIGT